ncbi:MAG: SagB/ThcOx family dehydrogenase, partial [Chloroflexi bacterium]|nr:SagB/ThcOx family dehydrogenase [Chloroflexota bacterium]
MNNREIQASWHYHDGTKHPSGYLLDPRHGFDPLNLPLLFKKFLDVETIPLPLKKDPIGLPALKAISEDTFNINCQGILDLSVIARLLHYSAGITKTIRYPGGETRFRAAACTGALYHIELYVVSGDLSGLDAGVYQFDPREMALRRLRAGDHRRTLIEASANEPSMAHAPAILVYTDIFWRNACKYQAREYRHAFWD